jgi:acyl-[acyl-carrier-protein]-phospholipid O-acyltransferase/long-chain-fatty-acid--[acyl-carrier-protein] ligase
VATAARPAAGERIGVMLPNVNGLPVTLLSLWAAGKVPAMLNFSSGVPTMLNCAQLAGLKHIVTSRQFLEKARLKARAVRGGGHRSRAAPKACPRASS